MTETDAAFPRWYEERRGFTPFPWMMRLAALAVEGLWPAQIALPTGSGKSEIALIWAWAREQSKQQRRLWIVSDRRVIVDQAHEGAGILERDGVLVSRLRGGIALDREPMLNLERPQVISATVDQLGSRLLFRGYGVSPRAWPIHAALAGTDSLIVLDEAHLSANAEDVFNRCKDFGADVRVVSMTATPRGDTAPFGLEKADHADPALGRRLRARRHVEPRAKGDLSTTAAELIAGSGRRVAAVANTVSTARESFTALQDRLGSTNVDMHLLTGRQRPLDRDRILAELVPRLRSGAAPRDRPIVVVTTQSIEAGADFDFDTMVTEGCPIDALMQRLGRLDRLGTSGDGRCVFLKPPKDAPPYGRAPLATWSWLSTRAAPPRPKSPATIDLGYEAWSALAETVTADMRSAAPQPVTLLAAHLRMLTRTSPRPSVEPDASLLLHGPKRAGGAVTIVWRHALDYLGPDDVVSASRYLRCLPPSSLEGCPVPVGEVRAWLEGHEVPDSGDVEGATAGFPEDRHAGPGDQAVFRWEGSDKGVVLVAPKDLHPGDVLVVPATSGGYDAHGWAPASTEPVLDCGAEAAAAHTGEQVLDLVGAADAADIDTALREGGFDGPSLQKRISWWLGGAVVRLTSQGRPTVDPAREVELDLHQARVASQAGRIADALGFDPTPFRLAGLHHDDGKRDFRWQIAIHGGDPGRAASGPPLAKGYYVNEGLLKVPHGWRHERESLRRMHDSGTLATLDDEDRDLVHWLVATHHGYGRPLWPDHAGLPGNEAWELAVLQDRLERRLGPWSLALREAILRLADQEISRLEASGLADEFVQGPTETTS